MQSYQIDHDVARRAAQDYLTIKAAGMVPELLAEIRLTIESHNAQSWIGPPNMFGRRNPDFVRLDSFRDGQGWNLKGIEADAERLAKLLECDPADVLPYVFDGEWDGPTTRGIALQVLRDVANQARRRLTVRRQQAGRRTA